MYLHLKINPSGSFSSVSAISSQFLPFLPGRKVFFLHSFSPWQGRNTFLPGRKPTLMGLIINSKCLLKSTTPANEKVMAMTYSCHAADKPIGEINTVNISMMTCNIID